MKRRIRHYISSIRSNDLHRKLCKCYGHGFRYHILGIGKR